ncbi:hypothetical protein ABWH91_05565 [Phycisphaerales bacterium ac7]
MHALTTSIVTTLVLWISSTALGQRTIHVVLPPNADLEVTAPALQEILRPLIVGHPDLSVSDVIAFYDGLNARELARVEITETASPHAAKRRYTPVFTHLIGSLQANREAQAVGNRQHAINLNRTVRLLDSVIDADDGRDHALLIVGALHHLDPRDGAWTFAAGEYFNDAAILAASSEVPFGTSDRKGALDGVKVYFIYTDDEGDGRGVPMATGMWAKFFDELGASLEYCNSDPTVGLRKALAAETGSVRYDPIDRGSREIKKLRTSEPQAVPSEADPTTELEVARESIPQASDGKILIAAVWSSRTNRADIDLWVRGRRGGPELNFGNTSIPGGVYLRDITSGGSDRVESCAAPGKVWNSTKASPAPPRSGSTSTGTTAARYRGSCGSSAMVNGSMSRSASAAGAIALRHSSGGNRAITGCGSRCRNG